MNTLLVQLRTHHNALRCREIELLDHVIVGDAKSDPQGRGFFSFREAGHL
jgi:DNA repair protein RadC